MNGSYICFGSAFVKGVVSISVEVLRHISIGITDDTVVVSTSYSS